MNIPYLMKRCTKCGEWKVASTINFYRHKKGKHGLQSYCKECKAMHDKQYRENNKEKIAEQGKQYREANKEKIAEYHKQWYETNRDEILKQQKQYHEANRDKRVEYYKRWREANKEKIAEYNKQYGKQYRENNKEKIAEHYKQWSKTPQGQVAAFNKRQRRRIKEEEQGTGITKEQWLEMMKFFDFRCAYSGEYIGGDSFNRTIDHIVPLNSGGDNMIWNCVPMTRSLNSSKQDKNMLEWYREQDFYDSKRLEKIYEWQEYAYNKYGKDTEYFNTNDIQIKLL